MEENIRKEEAKKAVEEIQTLEDTVSLENMLKTNTFEFDITYKETDKENKVRYRIRIPTWAEKNEVEKAKQRKYLELINETDKDGKAINLFAKEWAKKYKEQGRADIEKMEDEIVNLQTKINELLLKVTKAKVERIQKDLAQEVRELKQKQREISAEKAVLLEYSIEIKLSTFVNSYLTYLVLEKKAEDKWERVFKQLEDFQNSSDHELINTAIYAISILV